MASQEGFSAVLLQLPQLSETSQGCYSFPTPHLADQDTWEDLDNEDFSSFGDRGFVHEHKATLQHNLSDYGL